MYQTRKRLFMIKLIAIDLDGTLLNHQKELVKENIEAVQAAAASGVTIVICTGRPKSGTKPYFEQLGLSENEFLILNNGCSSYQSRDWQLIQSAQLSLFDVSKLHQLCQDYPGVDLTLTAEQDFYVVSDHVPELVQYDGDLVFTTVKATSIEALQAKNDLIFQAMYMGEKPLLDQFEAAVRKDLEKDYSVVRSQDYILEIMPKNVTKAWALKALAEHLKIDSEHIMAIGDAANDLEMISYAGLGIAMGNASQAVKNLADAVTADCDHAGVAQAIKTHVLRK